MTDTALQTSPITLDRRLILGETDYQVTVFPTEDRRLDLCIVSSDDEGRVISEISGGIAPADLPGLTEVLASTLAGLLAMTGASPTHHPPAPPGQRGRSPNHGTRWNPEDDARLIGRYREGAGQTELATEFGRSSGGIRARLEYLGEVPVHGPWRPTDPPPEPTRPPDPAPEPGD